VGAATEFITVLSSGIAGASLIAVTCYAFYVVYRSAQYRAVLNSGLQNNNSEVTQNEFIRLLDRASKEMIIYDDGDTVADSIYDNDTVIRAVHEKLDACPNLEIRCLFNCDSENLRFRKEFAGPEWPGVQIKTRAEPGGRYSGPAPVLPHFKMVDGGSCAYLSWHDPGSEARVYQTIDLSGVSGFGKNRLVRDIVGKYLDRFDRDFEAARPVN